MNAYMNSLIFFTKVSLSCVCVQLFFDYFLNLKNFFPLISYPFLHWLSNFMFYYLCGYLSIKIKDSVYFESYRIKQSSNIKKQSFKLNLIKIIQGELIFLLMCYSYYFSNLLDYRKEHSFSLIANLSWFYCCIISADFLFYITHYIFHTKKFYWIHKKHHEFIDVNGYVAEYKSLIESLIITTSDILLFIIFGCDIHQFLAWIIVGVIYNVEGHSCMNLFFITDNFHNKHHTHFNVNYGIGQYLDRIFGTDGRK